jgi:hypothetical protein
MAASTVAGVPVGAAVLAIADPATLRWGLAAPVLAAVAVPDSGWRYRGGPASPLTLAAGVAGMPVRAAIWTGGESGRPRLRLASRGRRVSPAARRAAS